MLTTNLYRPPATIPAPSGGNDLLQRRTEEFNASVAEFSGRWRKLYDAELAADQHSRAGTSDPTGDVEYDRAEAVRDTYRRQEELIAACTELHRERASLVAECLTALRVAFKEADAELTETIRTVTTDLSDQGWDAGCLDGEALLHSRSLRGIAGVMRKSARARLFEIVVVRSHPDVLGPRDRVHALRKEVNYLQTSDDSAEQIRKLTTLRRSVLQAAARDGAVTITI